MKIAMIGQKGIPARAGGVEHHVEAISNRLVQCGHEVIAYCRRSYNGESEPSCSCRVAGNHEVRRIVRPSIATKHLDAITHTAVCTLDVLFRNVDLLHYHAIGPAALAPIARFRGLPTVVTCHGLDWQRAKWGGFAKRCLRLSEHIAARCASQLVVVSRPLEEYFSHRYGVKARFIPNGVVPIARSEPRRIRQWDLHPRKYLLAASRLVPEKGLHYLIQACRSLEPGLKLVIAGSGGLDSEYEQLLQCMAGPNVVFTGNADRELMAELYSHAILFVLPSELEGMSIALLEAMSCQLPVVVSDIPENRSVVGDAGFTFRCGDAQHLGNVLESLLSHRELLANLGERCQQRAQRFQWSHVATELEGLYQEVVCRTRTEKCGIWDRSKPARLNGSGDSSRPTSFSAMHGTDETHETEVRDWLLQSV